MINRIGHFINKAFNKFGYELSRLPVGDPNFPVEASAEEKEIISLVLAIGKENIEDERLTMIGVDRLWAAITTDRYVVENDIEGDVVECGVWRGGCSIAMALALKQLKSSKKVILFDTFGGMTKPKEIDKDRFGQSAIDTYFDLKRENHNEWAYASIEDVRQNFITHKCIENVSFVKGDVLDTLQNPINLPNSISLLRLDTDWYESTKKELDVLYPLLQSKGVLLIDDYGWWDGSKKAVDEYFSSSDLTRPLLWKNDLDGRGAIKIS